MNLVEEYKKRLNTGRIDKNYYAPKTKANHFCCHCKNLIPKGTVCLTINRKDTQRVWVCDACLGLKLEITSTKCDLDSVAFGDEGASMALCDCLDELKGELYEREDKYGTK